MMMLNLLHKEDFRNLMLRRLDMILLGMHEIESMLLRLLERS